jgi:histidinol-phosphatase (PHP family)
VRIDYHIHTLFSDGRKGLVDYVDQAVKSGIDEIGFSDHVHFQKASWSMDFANLPDYLNEINALRRISKIPIKAGLEVDFVPSKMDGLMQTISKFDLDYLIGSVHYIGEWQIDSEAEIHRWRGKDIDQVYQQYFALIEEMVKSGLFDIVGHLDLPKKFGFQPKNDDNRLPLETVRLISKSNMCIEVSTGGLRKPCHEIYPSQDLLKMCFDQGLPITLGSDAHSPEDVGADFNKAISLLRKIGYTEIVRFNKRSKEYVEL